MRHKYIEDDYFAWIYNIACGDRFHPGVSFRQLLSHLHNTEFIYSLVMDEDRADDGVSLRYRFSVDYTANSDAHLYLNGTCSVLEMMIALALKMEDFMDDPMMGDRTGQWFWNMVVSLGLGSMNDDNYNSDYVSECLDRFLKRGYEPDGKGGLFTIRGCKDDLRDVEIWCQMCWYLNAIGY